MKLSSITSRFVAFALLQSLLIVVASVLIAFVTIPSKRPHSPSSSHHHKPPPRPQQSSPIHPFVGPVVTLLCVLGILLIGAILLSKWLVAPILALQKATQHIQHGDFETPIPTQRADELGDLARSFHSMSAYIQETLHNERTLLASLSHELRTPISRVRVAVEIAQESDTDNARQALLEVVHDLSEFESLLDDIFTSARLESTTQQATLLTQHTESILLKDLIQNAVARFQTRYPERPVNTRPHTSPERRVHGHPILLRRCIENLLENAHKYTPSRHAPIDIETHCSDTQASIKIKDSGEGIPTKLLQDLGKPFVRKPHNKRPGLGLGLTLVQRIVQAHHGTFHIESLPSQGTTAQITLPTQPPDEEATQHPPQQRA